MQKTKVGNTQAVKMFSACKIKKIAKDEIEAVVKIKCRTICVATHQHHGLRLSTKQDNKEKNNGT